MLFGHFGPKNMSEIRFQGCSTPGVEKVQYLVEQESKEFFGKVLIVFQTISEISLVGAIHRLRKSREIPKKGKGPNTSPNSGPPPFQPPPPRLAADCENANLPMMSIYVVCCPVQASHTGFLKSVPLCSYVSVKGYVLLSRSFNCHCSLLLSSFLFPHYFPCYSYCWGGL